MALLTDLAHQLREALSTARANDRVRIDEALRRFGVTGVHGEAEVGITSLIESVARDSGQPWIRVDLAVAAGEPDAAQMFAKGIARYMIGEQQLSLLHAPEGLWPTSAHRTYLALASEVGESVARCAIANAPADDVTVSETLDALSRVSAQAAVPPTVWVDHVQAPGLSPRHPLNVDKLLWNLRALQQRIELPVLISGHQLAAPFAFGSSGAFHGDGTNVTITRPGLDVWQAVAGSLSTRTPRRAWLAEMVEMAHGHPATLLLALALRVQFPEHASSAVDLWRLMLALDDGHASRAHEHAHTLHRLGGRLLEQIARGTGPYADAHGVSVKDIHRAVRRLHEAGLITQPRPRAWELTNPLVAGRLRGQLPLSYRDAVGPAHTSP